MDGRNGGGPGQDHAQCLGNARHGRCRTHDCTGAGRHGKLALDFRNFHVVDLTCPIARPEAPAIGASTEALAMMTPGHHRARDQHDRRQTRRDRAHQLRRHGLVAAAHQHRRIHWLRADHLLGIDRHEVAIFEARGTEEYLAQRDCRKRNRQCARGEHPAFDRLEQFGKMAMTIVEARGGIGDADYRLVQHRTRVAHRLSERTSQIQ